MKLIYIPHKFLYKTTQPYDFNNPIQPIDTIEHEMTRIMNEHKGIGLAANQIELDARIFIMKLIKTGKTILLINPQIEQTSQKTQTAIEGCLSNPGITCKITRPTKCKITYTNKQQQKITLHLHGIDARCAQHEIDHLNGINITDK